MEKIYEENRKKKQSFFQQFFNDKGSMIAVVVVAIVAVVGLIAFGFNQISFAADDVDSTDDAKKTFIGEEKSENGLIKGVIHSSDGSYSGRIQFTPFGREDGSYVISIDYMTDYGDGIEYTSREKVDDAGLVYLMKNFDLALDETEQDLAYFLKQTAVWAYLYDEDKYDEYKEIDSTKADGYQRMYNSVALINWVTDSVSTDGVKYKANDESTFWNDYGLEYIFNDALELKGQPYSPVFTVFLDRENDKLSLSDDSKYYITSNYITPSSRPNDLDYYDIDFSDAPDGTVIIDENDQIINNYVGSDNDIVRMDSMSGAFRLKIPVDKVTDVNKNFDITVSASFTGNELAYYVADGYQTMIDYEQISARATDIINVDINYTPEVPDTGMTTAQTIYFIGLIILLSGVGIIYANSKPQENN